MSDKQASLPDDEKNAAQSNPDPSADTSAEVEASDQELWDEMDAEEAKDPPPDDGQAADDGFDDDDQQEDLKQEDDPWAAAPQELRQSYEALKAEKERLEHRINSDDGRVAASMRRIRELQEQIKSVQKTEVADPAEKLKAFADDYPEVAGPLQEAMELLRGEVGELKAAQVGRAQAAQEELQEIFTAGETAVEEAHPGWDKYLTENSGKFAQWVDDQPRFIREAVIRNAEAIVDPRAAIEILNAFKHHMSSQPEPEPQPQETPETPETPPVAQAAPQRPPASSRRQQQLAASSSPSKTSSRAPVISGLPDDADEQALWDEMEELDRRNAGR
jgi:hypothetical protein